MGGLDFFYKNKKIEYDNLPDFLKDEAISKIQENDKVKIETIEIKADIKDLDKKAEELNQEYLRKEKEIVMFLECRKTFMGKIKYFFKVRKRKRKKIMRKQTMLIKIE